MTVHNLRTDSELGNPEPNENIIKALEELLDMAKDGRLQSYIGTGYLNDGLSMTTWLDYHADIFQMLGSLEWLKIRYISEHIEE